MNLLKAIIIRYAFVGILLFAAAVLIWLGLRLKPTWAKQTLFSLSALFIALFLYEVVSMFNQDDTSLTVVTLSQPIFIPDDVRGYRVIDEETVSEKKVNSANSAVAYDVQYTLRDGMRYCPNSVDTARSYAIFLGCSFTFGIGVNDDETLPYMFNEFSDQKYKVLNYAAGGYGTHQALAVVENKITRDPAIANSHNSVAIYYFLADHIRRAAGYSPWDYNGPRYEIVSDSIQHMGPFHKSYSYVIQKLHWIWRQSNLYRNFFDRSKGESSEYDVRRVLLMIDRMNRLLNQENVDLVVIVTESDYLPMIESFFEQNSIRYLKVEDAIPDLYTNNEMYRIPYDGHPNKLYNSRLGEYIAKHI